MKKGIYKIINPQGETYIGQSKNIEKRWGQYRRGENLEQRKLIRSFLKFGWVNHIFEILEECDNLIEKENYWIIYFNSQEEGLNGRIGGKYGSTFIYPEEAKIIKSKKMKEIWSNSGVKRKWEKPIIHLETQNIYPSMKSACLHFNISSTKLRKYLGENVFFSYI